MDEHRAGASPRALARIGGALYLVIIVIGIWGEVFVRGRILVPSDAAATAANLRAHEALWRSGVAAELVLLISAVALLLILFVLLRPVSRDLALLAAFFNLVSIAVEATATLPLLGALFPLADARYLGAFEPAQRAALARMAIRSHAHGFGISLIFFGCFCLVVGYLIFRSGFLPKALGVLMQIAGLCYLVNTFALILAPALADRLFPAILLPAFVGEASLCLWLLVKGVDEERWNARAGAQSARRAAAAV